MAPRKLGLQWGVTGRVKTVKIIYKKSSSQKLLGQEICHLCGSISGDLDISSTWLTIYNFFSSYWSLSIFKCYYQLIDFLRSFV